MRIITKIGIGIVIGLAFWACSDDDDFSNVPELFFRDFRIVGDTSFVWSLGFTDGDGDIGVRNDQDSSNFFPQGFIVENGVATPFPDDKKLQPFRIPVVENVVTRNGIEGEFRFDQELRFYRLLQADSIYIEAYVEDRAFNRSNVVRTPVFSLN